MHHNNIVPVYQFGEQDGAQFIVSRFIPGQALSEAVSENGMEPGRAVDLVIQLLEALTYAHEMDVLHRDVKPANAILDEKGQLHLMDFGLAGWVGQETGRMTQDGSVMGTPSYMAPEQAKGDVRRVGPAADQYTPASCCTNCSPATCPSRAGRCRPSFTTSSTPRRRRCRSGGTTSTRASKPSA